MKSISDKKYRTLKPTWWIIPAYGSIPLTGVLLGRPLDTAFWVMTGLYVIVSIFVFRQSRRTVVEIRNGELHFHEGIGLDDPAALQLSDITLVRRTSPSLLAFSHNGKTTTLQADKTILDQLEQDLR